MHCFRRLSFPSYLYYSWNYHIPTARKTPATSSRPIHQTASRCAKHSKKEGDVDDDDDVGSSRRTFSGTSTLVSSLDDGVASTARNSSLESAPYKFLSGYALFAKRLSRPFPPPFLSPPSTSFSEPLSTHNRALHNKQRLNTGVAEQRYDGDLIRGLTNGDDAALANDRLLAVNDGVGAWAMRDRGHAALWSRLLLHFWSLEAEKDEYGSGSPTSRPKPQAYLQRAYEHTKRATGPPNEWFGTTTFSGAILDTEQMTHRPRLSVTQLGDSKVLVLRPHSGSTVYKTIEQWHWFDCPRQLGTNSLDTPNAHAVTDLLDIEEGDVVVAMSDGVSDNLWEHEVVTNVLHNVAKAGLVAMPGSPPTSSSSFGQSSEDDIAQGMQLVARELVKAARLVAEDPFAESPFMERAVEEGLPTEGGKLDDISVVAAICSRGVTSRG